MPFTLTDTDCFPLVIDYEYEIVDKELLAEYVGELLLGHHFHVLQVIRALSPTFPIQPNNSIDKVIDKINETNIEKRDGWLFQMISWSVLGKRHAGNRFFSNYPQFAPAQHGIDGLALILNDDGTLKDIIITEDKCTTRPRGKITQQVFPELKSFEEGEKNNALVSIVSSLLSQVDAGKILMQLQNNIFDNSFRLYRIGVTREDSHNSAAGRNSLFLHYDDFVTGATPTRRSGASIHIKDLRKWMEDFAAMVIAYLYSKKS